MKQLNFGSTNGVPNDPNKTVVHLNIKEQARIILKKVGCVDDFIELLIREYGQDLCVKFVGSGVVGGYLSHWLKFNYNILPAEEFIRLNAEVGNPFIPFVKDDRVFNYHKGWGSVMAISEPPKLLCQVDFDSGECRWMDVGVLSFTPYTLQGFSQERPKPAIKPGQLIYVRFPEGSSLWHMAYFSHWDADRPACFKEQKKSGCTATWAEYSLTNPLEEK